MKTGVFGEHLGDIDTDALLQNVKNENRAVSSIDWLRESVPEGFTVTAEFELPVAETEADETQLREDVERRLAEYRVSRNLGDLKQKRKLVRIVLEAVTP